MAVKMKGTEKRTLRNGYSTFRRTLKKQKNTKDVPKNQQRRHNILSMRGGSATARELKGCPPEVSNFWTIWKKAGTRVDWPYHPHPRRQTIMNFLKMYGEWLDMLMQTRYHDDLDGRLSPEQVRRNDLLIERMRADAASLRKGERKDLGLRFFRFIESLASIYVRPLTKGVTISVHSTHRISGQVTGEIGIIGLVSRFIRLNRCKTHIVYPRTIVNTQTKLLPLVKEQYAVVREGNHLIVTISPRQNDVRFDVKYSIEWFGPNRYITLKDGTFTDWEQLLPPNEIPFRLFASGRRDFFPFYYPEWCLQLLNTVFYGPIHQMVMANINVSYDDVQHVVGHLLENNGTQTTSPFHAYLMNTVGGFRVLNTSNVKVYAFQRFGATVLFPENHEVILSAVDCMLDVGEIHVIEPAEVIQMTPDMLDAEVAGDHITVHIRVRPNLHIRLIVTWLGPFTGTCRTLEEWYKLMQLEKRATRSGASADEQSAVPLFPDPVWGAQTDAKGW